jgi:hypothetical protein
MIDRRQRTDDTLVVLGTCLELAGGLIGRRPNLPNARLMLKVRVVMLGPKTISSGELALTMSAIAACASPNISSLRWLVANAPPWLALLQAR